MHQLQDVAQISRMYSQLVHPFSPASSKSSPLQVSSRYHGSAIQSATSGWHVPDDPPWHVEQSFDAPF